MKRFVCKWIEAKKGGGSLGLLVSCRVSTPWRRNSSNRATHAPILRFFVSDLLGLRPSMTASLFFSKRSCIAFPTTVQFHPYQHNARITTTTRLSPARDTENGVYERGASRPVRLPLSNLASPSGERNSAMSCLSCHVRLKAQLPARSNLLTPGEPAPATKSSY